MTLIKIKLCKKLMMLMTIKGDPNGTAGTGIMIILVVFIIAVTLIFTSNKSKLTTKIYQDTLNIDTNKYIYVLGKKFKLVSLDTFIKIEKQEKLVDTGISWGFVERPPDLIFGTLYVFDEIWEPHHCITDFHEEVKDEPKGIAKAHYRNRLKAIQLAKKLNRLK